MAVIAAGLPQGGQALSLQLCCVLLLPGEGTGHALRGPTGATQRKGWEPRIGDERAKLHREPGTMNSNLSPKTAL